MCQELIDAGVRFLHFYTLNLEASVVSILKGLGIQNQKKKLPWKKPSSFARAKEDVRPIFWCIKPKSYIARTADWDDFPNGRWGLSRSPAFGLVTDYPSFTHRKPSKEKIIKLWGQVTSLGEIGALVLRFLDG